MKQVFILVFTFFCQLCMQHVLAQSDLQVTHLTGEVMVGKTKVAVSSNGVVDKITDYCQETFPYFIGYNYAGAKSGEGYYEFTFTPAVNKIRLNFSGISGNQSGSEEISIWVNGKHYNITKAGKSNGCDDLAQTNERGNVAPCPSCSVSGWSGTEIMGPITTILLKDTIIFGPPAGSIFSLFISEEEKTYIPRAEHWLHNR